MILPFKLGEQFMDVVETLPPPQPKFVRISPIRPGSRRSLHCLQTGAQRLVHHSPERRVESCGNRSRPVKHIVVNDQCCPHAASIAFS